MDLWELNLRSGAVHLIGRSLTCSSDGCGLHLGSGTPPELGEGAWQ